tara:strand:- start:287 stop:580 length:294 start_codon:yes stop_codon:yes gene_type:complete
MKNLYLAVVLLFAFFIQGCAAALVGGLFYSSSKSKEQKRAFLVEFNKNNTERESKGLKPLDLCEAKVAFDTKWAFENKECEERFKDKVKKSTNEETD